jgi:hypothetical protein
MSLALVCHKPSSDVLNSLMMAYLKSKHVATLRLLYQIYVVFATYLLILYTLAQQDESHEEKSLLKIHFTYSTCNYHFVD